MVGEVHFRNCTIVVFLDPFAIVLSGCKFRNVRAPKVDWNVFCAAGGDEWKLVAEKLGLNADEIRFLDKRTLNPADGFLAYVARQRHLTVGDLYDVLCECGLPVMADKL